MRAGVCTGKIGAGIEAELIRWLEAGTWQLEAGTWKLEAGSWKLAAGSYYSKGYRYMNVLKLTIVIGAMSVVLSAGPVWAQTPPAQKPPATPPATAPATPAQTPPAQTPPATQATPPRPFPEGARIAYIDIQQIASTSSEGKAATTRIQELQKKKTAELGDKQKALQALQTKLQQSGTVLSDPARGQLEKDIEKANREIQFFQQDAQQEIQELQNQLQNEFQQRLQPIIAQVAQERSLHYVLSIRDSGAIWFDTGLDLSSEVIKRFDAASKTAPKK